MAHRRPPLRPRLIQGHLPRRRDAEGQPTKVAYEAAGVTAITDPLNTINRHTHHAAGDLVRVTDPTGALTEMTYDPAHRRTTVKDRLGDTTTTTFIAQHQTGFTFYNVTKLDRPDGTSVAYEYDVRGNPLSLTDRTGKT